LNQDDAVEAAVGQVLVHQQLLLLDAAAQEADQVRVLQLGDQLDLVLELLQALPGVRRAETASAELVLVGEVPRHGGQLREVVERELGAALLDPPQLQRLLGLGAVPGVSLRLPLRIPPCICRTFPVS
jgi:hypothetical protein